MRFQINEALRVLYRATRKKMTRRTGIDELNCASQKTPDTKSKRAKKTVVKTQISKISNGRGFFLQYHIENWAADWIKSGFRIAKICISSRRLFSTTSRAVLTRWNIIFVLKGKSKAKISILAFQFPTISTNANAELHRNRPTFSKLPRFCDDPPTF